MADDIKYEKDPRLFDYNVPRIEEYHTPRMSKTDKGLIALFEAFNAMDWTQTQQARRTPGTHSRTGEAYTETNFPSGSAELIGKHPSRDKITALMGAEAVGYPLVVDKLNEPWKSIFQTLAIIGKASAVKNNQSLGLDAYRW